MESAIKKLTSNVIAAGLFASWQARCTAMQLEHTALNQIISELLMAVFIISLPFLRKEKIYRILAWIFICAVLYFLLSQDIPRIIETSQTEIQANKILKVSERKKDLIQPEGRKIEHPSPLKMVVRFKNLAPFDIPPDVVVRMGIVPFSGNSILEDKVAWVRSKTEGGIRSNESQSYSFDVVDISQVTFLVVTIQSETLPDGFLYDIYYTWNGGKNWALLRENLGNVNIDQVYHIQSFIDKIKSCVALNSKNKEYSHCFS